MGVDIGDGDLSGFWNAADLAAWIRRLKRESGLTLRELEARAHAQGTVLARSTISDVLRTGRLPSREVLEAFVRACGGTNMAVREWLEAHRRIAIQTSPLRQRDGPETSAGSDAVPTGADPVSVPPAAGPWRNGLPRALPLAAMAVALAGAWMLISGPAGEPPARPQNTQSPSSVAPAPAGRAARQEPGRGWVEIRPARTPHLCLTEGRDRTGAYLSAVAAQRPCTEARPPHTYLRPVTGAGKAVYRIEWHHSQHGLGCLTVRRSGPGPGLLEPWNNCAAAPELQQFRIEQADRAKNRPYRLRLETTGRCVGIRSGDTAAEAEAVAEPCGAAEDQKFLIAPVA